MEKEELIKRIESNKHDIVMRVRSVVKDPITFLNRKGAADPAYFNDQSGNNDYFRQLADEIMICFAEKWRNPKDSDDDQLRQMRATIKRVSEEVIPKIQEVVTYYSSCVKKSYYFSSSPAGETAKNKMAVAVKMAKGVCDDLLTLEPMEEKRENKNCFKPFPLLASLQEVLDDIEADVQYQDEYDLSKIFVIGDAKMFHNRVLLNIKENICNHGFGTRRYLKKHIWEKEVFVKTSISGNNAIISISNNGAAFNGDINKVFDYGYCYGEKRHNGIGMNSAKEHMLLMNGDLEFRISEVKGQTVEYIIIIPRGDGEI